MTEYCIGEPDYPTEEEIREKFKGARCLRIEKDEDGNIINVSCRRPCIVCGKYHHRGSKAEMRCAAKLMGAVYRVVNEIDEEVDE